jgi:hypothetical protein
MIGTLPGNLKYCRPSDIITASITWTVASGTSSTDTNYGLAALYDGKMARPMKFIDEPPAAIMLIGDAGSPVRMDAIGLPNSNLPSGTSVRVRLGSDPTFAAWDVDVTMVMGEPGKDGHVASPWQPFVTASGYTQSGFQYIAVDIPAGAVTPWLGELLVISTLREFSVWPQFGQRGASHPFLENLFTEYGQRRVVKRQIRQRRISYPFRGTDQDFQDLQSLVEDSGGVATPFFLVADSNVKTDGGLYGRLTADTVQLLMAAEEWFNLNNFTITFEEDSRSYPF